MSCSLTGSASARVGNGIRRVQRSVKVCVGWPNGLWFPCGRGMAGRLNWSEAQNWPSRADRGFSGQRRETHCRYVGRQTWTSPGSNHTQPQQTMRSALDLSDPALWQWRQSPCSVLTPADQVLEAARAEHEGWHGCVQMPSLIQVELMAKKMIPDPFKGINEEVRTGRSVACGGQLRLTTTPDAAGTMGW